MRLIDANELIATLEVDALNGATVKDAIEVIKDSPTVDAVPVVRCTNCKECEIRHTANYLPFLFCKHNGHSVSWAEYCSWGEWVAVQRGENETD